MWARLRRFSALPPSAKAVLVQAALLLPLIGLSLRLRGFAKTQKSLQSVLPGSAVKLASSQPALPAGTETQMVASMVLAAARHSPFPATCLERSLVLWWLLARRGMASQLRIGVRKTGEKCEAHAWVEQDGVALAEPLAAHLHYAPFAKEFNEEPS